MRIECALFLACLGFLCSWFFFSEEAEKLEIESKIPLPSLVVFCLDTSNISQHNPQWLKV